MDFEQRKWLAKKQSLLFPVEHQHLIFKFLPELSTIWLYNKRSIPKIMFDAAHNAIKKVNLGNSLNRGWLSVLHTGGGDLSYHPHIHTLITNGGLDDNLNWQEQSLVIKNIRTYYDSIIRKKILKALKKGQLILPPGIEYKEIVKIVKTKTFSIKQEGPYVNGKGVLHYISKKLKIGALNHHQVMSYDSEYVTFSYERYEKKEIVKLKRNEFIRRYLNHIPPKGLMLVRSCGIYSSRHQRRTKELKVELFGVTLEQSEIPSTVFYCPVCGKELSIVKKYNKKELYNVYKNLKIGNPDRPPPKYKEFVMGIQLIITQ